MKINILAIADALSDRDLFARIPVLAGRECEATARVAASVPAEPAPAIAPSTAVLAPAPPSRRAGVDPAAIFDQALSLLLDKVEKTKLAAAAKPRPRPPIRPGTDKEARKDALPSRHVPSEVKRVVWQRDGGQCAFVSSTGRRCAERTFLELHLAALRSSMRARAALAPLSGMSTGAPIEAGASGTDSGR